MPNKPVARLSTPIASKIDIIINYLIFRFLFLMNEVSYHFASLISLFLYDMIFDYTTLFH
jgi:hypothetical protein